MMDHKAVIEIKEITKSFGEHVALDQVSMDIPKGKIFGLLGPNGAGKTTLIRIITQITGPDYGKVLFNGDPLVRWHTSRVGYLPEERGLYRKMTVWEQAIYLVRLKGLSKADATDRLKHWFERLQMTSWVDKRVEDLSKGMQQKLQFVITVANEPEILILDEPFSGFDPVNTEVLKQEILQLRKKGTTIIFSTHNMASVEELCDRIALIHKGKKVLEGSISEIRNTFSKSLYEVHFKGSKVAFATALGHDHELLEILEGADHSKAEVKSHLAETSANLILGRLVKHVDVISFREKLPSMHDVFIDLVTQEQAETI